jgi:hypothetical protein
VNTPSGAVGVKGIKVRTSRWFHTIAMRTNASGYYSSSGSYYDDLLMFNDASYEVIFDGANGSNSWTFSATLFGALCFWTSSYGLGYHSPNGRSMTFYTNSDYWGRVVLHNAVYDYISYARSDGISLPPSPLDIASEKCSSWTSSAPLLKNHFDYLFASLTGLATLVTAYFTPLGLLVPAIWAVFPDLALRYNKALGDYNKIIAIAWHELTHASQLQRMKSEKGYWWASDYWSTIAYREFINSVFKGGKPYGSKGGDSWQVIALAEGWANYREWDLARRYLAWNSISGETWANKPHNPTQYDRTELGFPVEYAAMFYQLRIIGCSFVNIEKSLCAFSITGFRDNLTAKHPSLSAQITNIIQPYE